MGIMMETDGEDVVLNSNMAADATVSLPSFPDDCNRNPGFATWPDYDENLTSPSEVELSGSRGMQSRHRLVSRKSAGCASDTFTDTDSFVTADDDVMKSDTDCTSSDVEDLDPLGSTLCASQLSSSQDGTEVPHSDRSSDSALWRGTSGKSEVELLQRVSNVSWRSDEPDWHRRSYQFAIAGVGSEVSTSDTNDDVYESPDLDPAEFHHDRIVASSVEERLTQFGCRSSSESELNDLDPAEFTHNKSRHVSAPETSQPDRTTLETSQMSPLADRTIFGRSSSLDTSDERRDSVFSEGTSERGATSPKSTVQEEDVERRSTDRCESVVEASPQLTITIHDPHPKAKPVPQVDRQEWLVRKSVQRLHILLPREATEYVSSNSDVSCPETEKLCDRDSETQRMGVTTRPCMPVVEAAVCERVDVIHATLVKRETVGWMEYSSTDTVHGEVYEVSDDYIRNLSPSPAPDYPTSSSEDEHYNSGKVSKHENVRKSSGDEEEVSSGHLTPDPDYDLASPVTKTPPCQLPEKTPDLSRTEFDSRWQNQQQELPDEVVFVDDESFGFQTKTSLVRRGSSRRYKGRERTSTSLKVGPTLEEQQDEDEEVSDTPQTVNARSSERFGEFSHIGKPLEIPRVMHTGSDIEASTSVPMHDRDDYHHPGWNSPMTLSDGEKKNALVALTSERQGKHRRTAQRRTKKKKVPTATLR